MYSTWKSAAGRPSPSRKSDSAAESQPTTVPCDLLWVTLLPMSGWPSVLHLMGDGGTGAGSTSASKNDSSVSHGPDSYWTSQRRRSSPASSRSTDVMRISVPDTVSGFSAA